MESISNDWNQFWTDETLIHYLRQLNKWCMGGKMLYDAASPQWFITPHVFHGNQN